MVSLDLADSTQHDTPRSRGWAIVDGDIDMRPSDGLRARECDQCRRVSRPAWKCAPICVRCFAGDWERAYRQRRQRVIATYKAALEAGVLQ